MDQGAERVYRRAGLASRVSGVLALAFGAGQAWGAGGLGKALEAGEAQPEAASTAGHLVREVRIVFERPHPSHPSVEALLQAELELVQTDAGLSPPEARAKGRKVKLAELSQWEGARFSDVGLASIAPAVRDALARAGLKLGVYVLPSPDEFKVVDNRVVDARPTGADWITLLVTTGEVKEVHTRAQGERINENETFDHPLHAWIRSHSPLQPTPGDGNAPRQDLLNADAVNDFAHRLSRHPGRRVDVAVAATGTERGAVAVDYIVTENRPWMIFGQVSNTGTRATERLREHLGFIHNNLTNHDDVLSLGYQTGNFSDSHTLYASYSRPIDDERRWRARGYGHWYTYSASEVGFSDAEFEGDGWNLGGEVIWNFHQDADFFADLVAGATYKSYSVDNNLAAISGDSTFFVPHLRVRAERHRDAARTDAEIGIEFNLSGLGGTEEDLDALGRSGAEGDWVLIKGSASHSFFVEPLLDWIDDAPRGMAHEISLSLSGQHALGNRLIPNETQTAGGLYTVRGYGESATAGDTAVVASAEYRYHVVRGLDPDPNPGELFGGAFRFRPQYKFGPTDWDLVLKGFVDAGRTINSDRRSFEADQTLLGAGIGVEVSYQRNISLRLDWGFALLELEDAAGNEIENAGHNELHFVITVLY